MSTPDIVMIGVGIPMFIGMIVCMGYAFYLGKVKGEIIASHLKNCSRFFVDPPYLPSGIRGTIWRVSSVTSVFLFTRYLVRKGFVSQEDVDEFPRDLRFKLLALHWVSTFLFLTMLALYGGIHLGVFD